MTKLLEVLKASPVDPMPEKMRVVKITKVYNALKALETDNVPKISDWREIEVAIETVAILVKNSPWKAADSEIEVKDESGLLNDAMNAMAKAGLRYLDGRTMRLDGQGIAAVRGAVSDYATLLESLPHRVTLRAHIIALKHFHK